MDTTESEAQNPQQAASSAKEGMTNLVKSQLTAHASRRLIDTNLEKEYIHSRLQSSIPSWA